MPCSPCSKNGAGGSERQKQRTDSTHVLAKIRAINRLLCVGEAMRFALNSLAVVAGDWLLEHSDAAWLYRYGHRMEERRLPQSQAGRLEVAETIGQDGWRLLADVFDPAAPADLARNPCGRNPASNLGAELSL